MSFTFISFFLIFITILYLFLANWVYLNSSTNKVPVDLTLGLLSKLYYLRQFGALANELTMSNKLCVSELHPTVTPPTIVAKLVV